MAEGFPATTGDIFTAADYNGLVAFTIGAAQTADYTAVIADTYQVLEPMMLLVILLVPFSFHLSSGY